MKGFVHMGFHRLAQPVGQVCWGTSGRTGFTTPKPRLTNTYFPPIFRSMNMGVWNMGVWNFSPSRTPRGPHRDPSGTPPQPSETLGTPPEPSGTPPGTMIGGGADSWLPGTPPEPLRDPSGKMDTSGQSGRCGYR